MHKKSTPGKKTGARSRARAATAPLTVGTDSKAAKRSGAFSHIPLQVGEILSRRGLSQPNGGAPNRGAAPASKPSGVSSQAPAASLSKGAAPGASADGADWLEWVRSDLPSELAPHVVQVLLRGGTIGPGRQLLVFADSPAWCARLRYALLGLEQRIRARDPTIARVNARVLRLD